MEQRNGLKIVLGVLAVLAIAGAVWRVLSYEANFAKTRHGGGTASQTTPLYPLAELKRSELLDEPEEITAGEPSVDRVQPALSSRVSGTVVPSASAFEKYPSNRATPRVAYPGRHTRAGQVLAAGENNYPTVHTPAYAGGTHGPVPVAVGSLGSQPTADQQTYQERTSRILAPFLRTNRKDQERMDARWAQFAAALDRAVLQALMPKSKKAQMIEKYAAKSNEPKETSQIPGFDGSLSPVGQTLATQKHQVVTDLETVFGSDVAGQAGGIMDRFSAELSSALNTPGLSPEQAAQRVKEISNKYQKEMDSLSQKAQYDKFAADLEAKDNQQKEALRTRYADAQLNDTFSQILDQARAQKLALATRQDLTQQEHFTQESQIDQDTYNKLKKAITQAGQSLNPFHAYERERLKEWVNTLGEQEEQGKLESFARAASADETQKMRTDVDVKTRDLMQGVKDSPLFDETATLEVQALLNDYKAKLENLYQQELSPKDRADGEQKALNEVNRALLDKQMEQVKKSNAPQAQKEKALAELREAYNAIP